MAAKSARKLTAADYTVGWICALPLELAASEGMLDRLHDAGSLSLSDGDQNSYILGEISGHNVVMACLPSGGMGLTSATTVAAGMMHSFPRIRFGLMVGIGGGAPNPHPSARPDEDIRLGDVVVSIPSGELGAIIKYDRGKVVAGGEFQHTGVLNLPPSVLTTAVSALQCKHETLANSISRSIADMVQKKHSADGANLASLQRYQHPGAEYDQLFEADYEHVSSHSDKDNIATQTRDSGEQDREEEIEFPCPHCDDDRLVPRRPRRRKDPVIHYGPIASADMVMRHGETREKLRKKYGILCFEMEAAGLMNDFPCLVIRGICDYSDTHKNKIWQRYAAATAAGYAKELLGTVKKAEVTEPRLERGAQDELQREHDLKHKELLEWLGPDTHTKKWADSRSKWHQGTGVTFIESQAFVNWFNDLAQTLWCRGIAGSGKTVFSALVLDRLHAARKDTKAAVICLFLEYERTQEQSLQALLAAVLRQLVQQCPEPPSSVVDLHASHTAHQSQPLLEELCSVVVDVMHKFPQVYLVVDALDECPDDAARDLLSNLRDVQQSTGMKLVTTSRPTIDLGEFFGEYETLEIRALEHDVRAVLESRMIKLPRLVREDKSLQKRIKDSIAEAVDGSSWSSHFLTRCAVSEQWAISTIKESTDKITTVYERTLKRIDDHPPKDQQVARRILAWVLLAKRPLSCIEFQHVLSVSVRLGEDFDRSYVGRDLEESVALCAGLVVINYESETVQLMHHTARNYFKGASTQLQWIYNAGDTISAVCVTYLLFSAFSAGPCLSDEELSARLQDFPFLVYAAQHWGNHLRESDEKDTTTSRTETLVMRFLRQESNVWSAHQALNLPAYGYPGYSQHFTQGSNDLQLAASFGLSKITRQLIAQGVDVAAMDADGGTALHRAAENGHVQVVLQLLREAVSLIDLPRTKHRHTALHLAALNGHASVVKVLLQSGACATLQDDEGWTALHVAAWTGKRDAVAELLKELDVHARGKDGVTALHCAAGQGQRTVAELLISHGADVNITDSYGWTALHWASKKRHDLTKLRQLEFKDESSVWGEQMKKVKKLTTMLRDTFNFPKKLVMMGEGVWSEPEKGEDGIAYAEDGLALDLSTSNGGALTMLYFSTQVDRFVPPWLLPKKEGQQIAAVRLILAVQDELGALQCLVQCGHKAVAELLLDNGANADGKCRAVVASKFRLKMGAKPTALHMAGLSAHEAMARILLDRGADPEALCELGVGEDWLTANLTPLHCAVISGNKRAVQLFLDKGSDVNATCYVGIKNLKARITSLHLAIIWGHAEVATLLLDRGADTVIPCYIMTDNSIRSQKAPYAELNFSVVTDLKVPIIHLASTFGSVDILWEILQRGANCQDPLQGSFDGYSFSLEPLHIAALLGHFNTIDMLVTHGASLDTNAELAIDSTTRLSLNALQLATLSNSIQAVDSLLNQGANVHAKGQLTYGKYAQAEWTALHCAALLGDPTRIRLLIEAGADADAMLQGQVAEWVPASAESMMEQAAKMFAALLGDSLAHASMMDVPPRGSEGPGHYGHFELHALHLAALSADEDRVEALLEQGAEVNTRATVEANNLVLEVTPLHVALIWQGNNTALRLLRAGADVDTKLQIEFESLFRLEMTPLHLAALAGDEVALIELADRGATDTQAVLCIASARMALSSIHLAAIGGSHAVTETLLSLGSYVDTPCSVRLSSATISMTPLHFAALFKHRPLLGLLVERGADSNRQVHINDSNGSYCITPLHLLLLLGHANDLDRNTRLLLSKGADASMDFRVHFTSQLRAHLSTVHLAAMTADWNAVKQLLQMGANAANKGSLKISNMHLDVSILHIAAFWKRYCLVERLIEDGTDPDASSCLTVCNWPTVEITPLHLAALRDDSTLVELLLRMGATAHLFDKTLDLATTQNNVSPLHLAILLCNLPTVISLVEHGASPLSNLKISTEKFRAAVSALGLASIIGSIRLTKFLVQRGADVNSTCFVQIGNVELQFTPLAMAALQGNQPKLVYLLKHGADPHKLMKVHFGRVNIQLQPLHLAARGPDTRKLVRVLLKYKADPRAYAQIAGSGWCVSWTALHSAALHDKPTVAELLLNNGADVHDNLKLQIFSLDAELQAIHLAIVRNSSVTAQSLLARGGNEDTTLRLTVNNLATQLSALHVALLLKRGPLMKLLFAEEVDLNVPYIVAVRQQLQAEVSALQLSVLSGGDDRSFTHLGKELNIHTKYQAKIDMVIQFQLKMSEVFTVLGTQQDATEPLVEQETPDQDLDQGNTSAGGGNLPLYLAVALGWDAVLKLLLERTNEVNQELTVRIQAAVDADFPVPPELGYTNAIEVNIMTNISAFHLAAVLGNIEPARLLLSKGANVDAVCQMRTNGGLQATLTPLMLATLWKHYTMIQLLLEKDASVSQAGQVVLQRAVESTVAARSISVLLGDKRVSQVLKGVERMRGNIKIEITSLHLAVLLGDSTIVQLLLEQRADPDMPCQVDVEANDEECAFRADFQVHLTPLHLATWVGHKTVAALLLDRGASVDARIQAGGTATLNSGAEISEEMQPRGTALHVAAGLGKEEMVRVLREHGADMDARTRDGRTAFEWAGDQDGGGVAAALTGFVKGFMQRLQRTFYDMGEGQKQ